MLDRLLRHIGEHGIGAAEGHDRHLGVERGDGGEDIARPVGEIKRKHRAQPQRAADQGDGEEARQRRTNMRRDCRRERGIDRRRRTQILRRRAMAAATGKPLGLDAIAGEADQRRARNDQRKRDAKEKYRDERQRRDGAMRRRLQRPLADAHDRFQHDGEHGGFQPEEQRRDRAQRAECGIDPTENSKRHQSGQHKERAGDDAAADAMQEPADIDRELMRLGARQQHAVVQRVQESLFADPALLLDQDAMHHRDLPGRPAEAKRSDPRPGPRRLGERNRVTRRPLRRSVIAHRPSLRWLVI